MKALVVPANGSPRVEDLAVDDLASMQKLVGGYLEAIAIPGAVMWVNEDGVRLSLPANVLATDLVRGAAVLRGAVAGPIVGDVVLTGPPDEDGDWTDVPQELIDAVRRAYPSGGPADGRT